MTPFRSAGGMLKMDMCAMCMPRFAAPPMCSPSLHR